MEILLRRIRRVRGRRICNFWLTDGGREGEGEGSVDVFIWFEGELAEQGVEMECMEF